VAGSFCGCQRFFPRAEAFACFLGDATFAVGTITLCTGIKVGCPACLFNVIWDVGFFAAICTLAMGTQPHASADPSAL